MKLIIDIPEDEYNEWGKNIKNAIPIPDNATNGDVLKMMFPNIENQMIDLVMRCGTSIKRIGDDIWMNLPYQKGGEK